VIEQLYTQPPPDSGVVGLDAMGPDSAKSYPGQQVIRFPARAKQEIDYGRRAKGYVFGAFRPASGEAFTPPYTRRTILNGVDFLTRVEAWIPPEVEHVYAIVDKLSTHRATDLLLFSLTHPRWAFIFQPKYAAYLNLIEPWWKIWRSLALNGRRFATWQEMCDAVEAATVYWNAHRHPFTWGNRRHRRSRRQPAIARLPTVA
jgi:hypothetical protein